MRKFVVGVIVSILGFVMANGQAPIQSTNSIENQADQYGSLITSVINRTVTYQGILKDNTGNPVADATYNLTIKIYNNSSGGSLLWTSAVIPALTSDGYFSANLGTVSLPFDTTYYLSVQVQGDVEMSRQAMTMVPYAARSDTANYAKAAPGGSGNWTLLGNILSTDGYYGIMKGNSGNVYYGDSTRSIVNLGAVCTTGTSGLNVVNAVIGGGRANRASANFSTVSGGYGNKATAYYTTVSGGDLNTASGYFAVVGGGINDSARSVASGVFSGYLNTAGDAAEDTAAFVGGGYDNSAMGKYSIVGGGQQNFANNNWTTVSGGYYNTASGLYATIGGGISDTVKALYGGVASGYSNLAGDSTIDTAAFIGGGYDNSATYKFATIGGGYQNIASERGATIGGGISNIASDLATTVAGGELNTADGNRSVVGGGIRNRAHGSWATIAGGNENYTYGMGSCIPGGEEDSIGLNGSYSLVFGRGVYCNNNYRVVLFDSLYDGSLNINRDENDGTVNSYPIQVGTNTSNGNGAYLTTGGVWTNGSSRTFKENFTPIEGNLLLSKIAGLSITSWNYKNSTEKHVGPVAEEFSETFDTGVIREDNGQRENQYLAASDVAGVALAGVQELVKQINELKIKNEQLERRLKELESH